MNNFYGYPKKAKKIQREFHTCLLLIVVGAQGRRGQSCEMHVSICSFFNLEKLAIGQWKNHHCGMLFFSFMVTYVLVFMDPFSDLAVVLSLHILPLSFCSYGFWRLEKQTYLSATVIELVEAFGINFK